MQINYQHNICKREALQHLIQISTYNHINICYTYANKTYGIILNNYYDIHTFGLEFGHYIKNDNILFTYSNYYDWDEYNEYSNIFKLFE